MTIKFYKKLKKFKTKNGTILRSFGFIEGPLMQMSKVFPHTFDTNENKKDKVGHNSSKVLADHYAEKKS